MVVYNILLECLLSMHYLLIGHKIISLLL